MFNNIEEKLKGYAKTNFVCGIILAILMFIIGCMNVTTTYYKGGYVKTDWMPFFYSLIIGVAIISISYMISLLIYGFAELLESTKRTDDSLTVAREARIAVYWEKHPEELAALTEKKEAAQTILDEKKDLDYKEKKTLGDIIAEVDAELAKDRVI